MDKPKESHELVQLNLFQPPLALPRWSRVPMEVRETVRELIAQMLSAHLTGRVSASRQKELIDE